MASETPPLLAEEALRYYQTFSKNISDFLDTHGIEVTLPKGALQGIKCWFVILSDGAHLHVYAETISEQSATCDQCRIIGWGTHPVSSARYHFIIPAETGPDSLQDPASLPSIAEACYCSKKNIPRNVSLPRSTVLTTADGHVSPYNAPSTIFDSTRHRLHGVLHANGFGHLLRVNGREGGSQSHTGYQIVTLWDSLCQGLQARKVTTEDVSSKIGMELRILYTAAYGFTWYGNFGYEFGRGPYNTSRDRWLAAMHMIQGASLAHLLHDFEGVEEGVPAVIKRYRLPIGQGAARVKDLGSLLYRLLYLQMNPKEAVQFFDNKAVAAAEARIKAQDDTEAAKRAAQRAGLSGGGPKLPPQQKSGGSCSKAKQQTRAEGPTIEKNPGNALPKIKLRLGPAATNKDAAISSPAVSPTTRQAHKRGRAAIEEHDQQLASPSSAAAAAGAAKRTRATTAAAPRPIIGRKVKVYYKDKRTWYHGVIEKRVGPASSDRYLVAFRDFKEKINLTDDNIKFYDGPAPVLGTSSGGSVSVVSGKMKEGKKKQQVPGPVVASPRKQQNPSGPAAGAGGDDINNKFINLPEVGSKVKVYNTAFRVWKTAFVSSGEIKQPTTVGKNTTNKKLQKKQSTSSVLQVTFLDGSIEELDFEEIKWQLLKPPLSSSSDSEEQEFEEESEEEEEEEEEEETLPPLHYKAILSRDDGVERIRQLTRALKSLCPEACNIFSEAKGRAELDAALEKLSGKGCPELTYTKTWWESIPKLLRWAQTGIDGAVGRGVKDAGKIVRLVDGTLEIDRAQLHALGLFPESWPAPFQLTAVKKANATVIAEKEEAKVKRKKEAEKKKLRIEKAKEKAKDKGKNGQGKQGDAVAEVKQEPAAGGGGARATRRSRHDSEPLVSLPDPVAPPLPRASKTGAGGVKAEKQNKQKDGGQSLSAQATAAAATQLPTQPQPTRFHVARNHLPAPAPALHSATAVSPLSEAAIQQLVTAPKGQDQLPAESFTHPTGNTLPDLTLPSDAPPWGLDRLETALNNVMAIAKAHKGRWVSPQRIVTLAQQSFSKRGLKEISLAQAAMAYLANKTFQGCAVHRYAHPESGNYYLTEELPGEGVQSPSLLRGPAPVAAVASPLIAPPPAPRVMSVPAAPALDTAAAVAAQKNQQIVKIENNTTTAAAAGGVGRTRNSKRQKAVDDIDDDGAGPSKPGATPADTIVPDSHQQNKGNKFKLRLAPSQPPGQAAPAQAPPPQQRTGISRSAIQQEAIDTALAAALAPVSTNALSPTNISPPVVPKGAKGLIKSPPPPPPPAWLSLVPGAAMSQLPSVQNARDQVSRDLHHVFTAVLKVYAPQIAKQAAEHAAQMAGERAATRVLKLKQLPEEVQVMRDTKHFLKACSGETLNHKEGSVPPKGHLRIWCKLAMPVDLASPPVAPTRFGRKFLPVDPPAELIVLPEDATLGQFMAAAQELYRGVYRMCAKFTASGVVSGLCVDNNKTHSLNGRGGGGSVVGTSKAPIQSPMAALWDPSMPLAAMLPKEPPHPGPALSTLIPSAADGGRGRGGGRGGSNTFRGPSTIGGTGAGAVGNCTTNLINTSHPGFAAGVYIPTVTIAGVGLDTTPVWLHAGGPEDWVVGCSCGTRDDDGEAMVACDTCGVWYHTRCVKVPDECPSYVCSFCVKKRKAY